MKNISLLLFPLLLLASPVIGFASEQLIPAGSLVQCTVSEPKLSSKTADVGDPVLCQVSHVELYGRSVFPYGSYLVGRFEDYKDPGHFVGKGWMELKFDRMVLPPDTVIPVAAKVVYVPKYAVDKEGRIHGKGHAVRDVVEWSIPLLWPIDLLTLPKRGPRPVLKAETRLTLKIMDDLGVPMPQQAAYSAPRDPYNFSQRAPMTYSQPSYMPQTYAPPVVVLPPPRPIIYAYAPLPPPPPMPLTVLIMRDGYRRVATDYRMQGDEQLRYIAQNGQPVVLPIDALDFQRTVEINRQRGIPFVIRQVAY